MFADYQALVLQTYHDKKAQSELPFHLSHPTAARLKAECLRVCEKRYHRKDENLLHSFFDRQEDPASYRNAIRKTDPDKFRPLVTYLKQSGQRRTSEKNIELLAWLIDFEPRPFRPGEPYPAQPALSRPKMDAPEQLVDTRSSQLPGLAGLIPSIKKPGKLILLAASATIVGITTYFILKPASTSIKGGCMYWDKDHYQAVPCNQPPGETPFYLLDMQKITHFRRITQPDTLTPHSLGSVWYIKINGRIEFYTASGNHPVDTSRHLLRLSSYILNKYIYHVPDHH
ncbi:hypothetical protein [Mucilaginibacter sp. 22184]|uniref:hypothetical protein n=1 Tax=Mucilaginibacter sp. 22184 TaxID=3453887 RepID=UPI003F841DC1